MGERIAREFIDMETPIFEAQTGVFPDPYALKRGQSRGIRRGGLADDPAAVGRPAARSGSFAMAARSSRSNPAIDRSC